MTFLNKTATITTALLLLSTPVAFAQSGTTLGGGGNTRAHGGGEGAESSDASTGRSVQPGTAQGDTGPGSPASSAAKGNDPTGSNGATNNRY